MGVYVHEYASMCDASVHVCEHVCLWVNMNMCVQVCVCGLRKVLQSLPVLFQEGG